MIMISVRFYRVSLSSTLRSFPTGNRRDTGRQTALPCWTNIIDKFRIGRFINCGSFTTWITICTVMTIRLILCRLAVRTWNYVRQDEVWTLIMMETGTGICGVLFTKLYYYFSLQKYWLVEGMQCYVHSAAVIIYRRVNVVECCGIIESSPKECQIFSIYLWILDQL